VIWKTTAYHMQTSGDYAITKCEGPAYFAWFQQDNLGRFDTADEARAACDAHRAEREARNV
jgi:hypothetical protein